MERPEALQLLEVTDQVLGVPVTAGHRDAIVQAWEELRADAASEDGEDQLRLSESVPAPTINPKSRSTDPRTSKAAALANKPRAGSQRARLLEAIVGRDPTGMTAEQASRATSIRLNSASTRMSELMRGGWIQESGETRRTSTGERAIVYVATEKARFHSVPAPG